jgi:hypothetical protein
MQKKHSRKTVDNTMKHMLNIGFFIFKIFFVFEGVSSELTTVSYEKRLRVNGKRLHDL